MKSGLVDSLRLALSDSYNIPDSDYEKLSGILLVNDLSEDGLESGLVPIINLLIKYDIRLPISLEYLRTLWGIDYISFNFVKMIVSMVKDGVVLLRKVKREKFISSENIAKGEGELEEDKDVYVTVYPTEKFNNIFNTFYEVLTKKDNEAISEGAIVSSKDLPNNIKNLVFKTGTLLDKLHMKITEESYVEDEVAKTAEMNFIISDTSDYTCKDSDVLRVAKKHLLKVKSVKSVDAYIESTTEVFLGVNFSVKEASADMSNAIFKFMEELELNYVEV